VKCMAITLQDVAELRARVEATRKELEEQEHALRVLERMLASDKPLAHAAAPERSIVRISDLKVDLPHESSVSADIRSAVCKMGDQEFSVPHVEAILQGEGKMPKGKAPRATIASFMAKFVEEGLLERTFAGKGSQPHRYKLTEKAQMDLLLG